MNIVAMARAEEMVRLRESAVTLIKIGSRFGVTRERVRQILKQAGRPDLCRVPGIKPDRAPTPPKPSRLCEHCKEPFIPRNSTTRFCSGHCRAQYRGLRFLEPRCRAVMRLWTESPNATWDDVARNAGWTTASNAIKGLKRYGEVTGIDVMPFFKRVRKRSQTA